MLRIRTDNRRARQLWKELINVVARLQNKLPFKQIKLTGNFRAQWEFQCARNRLSKSRLDFRFAQICNLFGTRSKRLHNAN